MHAFLRFRHHQNAIHSDLKAMYYQVIIPETHKGLRLLWYVNDHELAFTSIESQVTSISASRRTV